MSNTNYLDGVAELAALKVRASVRKGVGRLLNATRGNGPNDLGNYPGKRKPKPPTKLHTPEEMFFLLAATYDTFRKRRVIERRERAAADTATWMKRRDKRAARRARRLLPVRQGGLKLAA